MTALLLAVAALGALLAWPLAVRAERRRRIAADLRANAAGRVTLLEMWRANGGGLGRTVFVVVFAAGMVLAIVWLVQHPER